MRLLPSIAATLATLLGAASAHCHHGVASLGVAGPEGLIAIAPAINPPQGRAAETAEHLSHHGQSATLLEKESAIWRLPAASPSLMVSS